MGDFRDVYERARDAWLTVAARGGPLYDVQPLYHGLGELGAFVEAGGPQNDEEHRQLAFVLRGVLESIAELALYDSEDAARLDLDPPDPPAVLLRTFEKDEQRARALASDRGRPTRLELLGILRRRVETAGITN